MARLMVAALLGTIAFLVMIFLFGAMFASKVPVQVFSLILPLAIVGIAAVVLRLVKGSQPASANTQCAEGKATGSGTADASSSLEASASSTACEGSGAETESSEPIDSLTPGVVGDSSPKEQDPLALLFASVTQELRRPVAKSQRTPTLLLLSVLLFFAYQLIGSGSGNAQVAIFLVAALFLHEMGHALAMRLLGYSDVKVFFIPFFGAMTTGVPKAVVPWKQTIVLLAGPLPGVALGLLIPALHIAPKGSELAQFSALTLALNLFNLLPVEPLDGGKLLGLLAFSRWPRVRVIVSCLMVLPFLMLLRGSPAMWIPIVGFTLVAQIRRYRGAIVAANVKAAAPCDYSALAADIAELSDAQLLPLFREAHARARKEAGSRREVAEVRVRVELMRLAFEFLKAKPPSAALSVPVIVGLLTLGAVFIPRFMTPTPSVATVHRLPTLDELEQSLERQCVSSCLARDNDPSCSSNCACERRELSARVDPAIRLRELSRVQGDTLSAEFLEALLTVRATCEGDLYLRRLLQGCIKGCKGTAMLCQNICDCYVSELTAEGDRVANLRWLMSNIDSTSQTPAGQARLSVAAQKCSKMLQPMR